MTVTKDFDSNTLEKIRELYERAFPKSEKKRFSLMLEKCSSGEMQIRAILGEENDFLGLAIFILHGRIALLDYFAIAEDKRGSGIGTDALEIIKGLFSDKILLLEIEDSDEAGADNFDERVRREKFYTSRGMRIMPYRIMLFGVQMRVLTNGEPVDFNEYHRIFEDVFSPKSAQNVKLI